MKELDNIVRKVLTENFSYKEYRDGIFYVSPKNNPDNVQIILDVANHEETIPIQASIASSCSEITHKRFTEQSKGSKKIEDEIGTLFLAENFNQYSLLWITCLEKAALQQAPNAEELFKEGLNAILEVVKEKKAWAHDNLIQTDYSFFAKDMKTKQRCCMYDNLGEGMFFVTDRIGNNCYLLNTTSQTALELVDVDGKMVAFSPDDVDPSVIERDVDSDNARNLMAKYRFWVYKFNNGKAKVEWTVIPDGCFFADEDGFGAENNVELTVTATIDKDGKIIKKFR